MSENNIIKHGSNMDMDKDIYTDPSDETMKKVLDELKGLGGHEEIKNLIFRVYPTWLVHSTDRYSLDYPHLNSNWDVICKQTGVEKQKIVIVDAIVKDDEHLLINIFCERMTREGYVVRRKEEFTSCKKCGAAIPVERLYDYMKSKDIPVPDRWSNKCSTC